MATKLRALGSYSNGPRNLHFLPGEVFEVTGEMERYLMADAPGTFEEYVEPEPEVKATKAQRNKMVIAAEKDK